MTDSLPPLQTAFRTERGPRPVNQDAVASSRLPDGRWLAAVADGMGGLEGGEIASHTAIEALLDAVGRGGTLVPAVEAAHLAVQQKAAGQPMGTTLVAALIDSSGLRIASVGDSRAYLAGPAGLVQVTRDHTVGAEAAGQGEAPAEHVVGSRWGRALTRSLGSTEPFEIDQFGPFRIEEGVRVLLTSDGVHGVLPHEVIEAHLVGVSDLDTAVNRLVDAALDHGSRDNVSAVILELGPKASITGEGPRGGERTPEEVRFGTQAGDGRREDPGFLPRMPAEVPVTNAPRWDVGTLVTRSHNPMRRKPGRLQAAVLMITMVLAIAAIVLLFG